MPNFASRLKKLRKDRNMLQKNLAEELDLAQTTIANYEQNKRFPNQETLIKIARYFNVSLDYMLGQTEKPYMLRELLEFSRKGERIKLNQRAENYLNLILSNKKEKAYLLIRQYLEEGIKIEDIYLGILEPALKEVGFLWETNQIDVSEEHLCSNITIQLMNWLQQYFISKDSKDKKTADLKMAAVTANAEQHNIGLKMVTDFFELRGWNTFFLGTNTPSTSIVQTINKYKIDIMTISATMDYNLDSVKNLVSTIKKDPGCLGAKIMVGGTAFTSNNWKITGADGYAADARKAVKKAEKLIDQN